MRLKVKSHPKSTQAKVVQVAEGYCEIWVREAPDKGKANQAIIEALSVFFKVPKSKILILSGHQSRLKVFEIAGP